MTTNLEYIRREHLKSMCAVTLYVNLGASFAPGVDITEYVKDLAVDIAEGVVDTSGDTAGQLIDKVDLQLDNTRGDFETGGRLFGLGFVNNSKIKIVSNYREFSIVDGYVVPGAACPPYTFNGIIKADSSSWTYDPKSNKFDFNAGCLQASNILASEIVNAGYVSPGSSLAQTVFQIMQQPSIAHVVTTILGNINLGYDIAAVVDTPLELVNKKVLDIVNLIGILSNSKWYIDSDGNFIMEPIANSGASSWDLTGEDIVSVDEVGFNALQLNSATWDDGTLPKINVQMNYALRQQYAYDCFEKQFDAKFIADATNRQNLLQAFVAQNQYQHRQITFTAKANPDLRFNQLITLNLPRQYANISNQFIWGESEWGDGSMWGPGIPGLIISPGISWRVLSVTRKLNLAPDMQVIAVQAGQGPDTPL